MIGMDFSYYKSTNLKQTQYYGILKKILEQNILISFTKLYSILFIKNIFTLITFIIGIRIYF